MLQYNDKYIIKKIVNYKFTFSDLNPKLFPQLRHGAGLYCPFHETSRTGTQQARIYYNEEMDQFYLYCYAEQKAYTAFDYLDLIMCKQKQLYKNPLEFIKSKMDKDEFIALYKIFEKNKTELMESQFKQRCEYIDNLYQETEDIIDYIERLYTA